MGEGNKVEMLIALCAVLTSAVAVFIAWDQGRVMRAQQHGAVFPVLQVDGFVSSRDDRLSMGVRFTNSGVGPALIRSIRVSRDGAPVESLLPYRDRLPEGYDLSWQSMIERAVAPGERTVALDVSWPREGVDPQLYAETAMEWSELALEVCYCSVFDRCWRTSDETGARAQPVAECPPSPTDIFAELSAFSGFPEPSTPETD